MEQKTIFEQLGGTYIRQGDYLLTNIKLPEQPEYNIGVWGQRRRRYLKQHRQIIYTNLLTSSVSNPEGRTYSPPIKWAVVLLKQTCDLRGLRLRWSLAEAAAEPSPSVRLSVRQPHCQRCTTALTSWVSLRRHPVLLIRNRNTFCTAVAET